MAEESANETPDFADGVLRSLGDAVHKALDGSVEDALKEARNALNDLVKAGMGGASDNQPDDPCKTTTDKQPPVAAACLARDLALKTAARNEDRSVATGRSTLLAARETWRQAVDDYEHNVESAATTMQAAVTAAVVTYTTKINKDSRSRNQVLYYTLMGAAATALQTYQGTAQSEDATLATAAGALLTAYVAYIMAVEAAHAQRMADDATAHQTFWTTIEGFLDAP